MKKIRYDSSLDNDHLLKKQADYYEGVSIEDGFDLTRKRVNRGTNTKRVNIVIPEYLYEIALEIGNHAGTGYQNALKMAIVIGLNDLKTKTNF